MTLRRLPTEPLTNLKLYRYEKERQQLVRDRDRYVLGREAKNGDDMSRPTDRAYVA